MEIIVNRCEIKLYIRYAIVLFIQTFKYMSIMFFRHASLSIDQIGDQLARQQEQGHQQHQP